MTGLKATGANRVRNLIAAVAAIVAVLTLAARPLLAKEAKEDKKRRVIPITINKGETYTISDVKKGAAPSSKVVENPNALVMHTDSSGSIILLGTEGGSWKLDVTLASGEKVTYAVNVKADAPPINSLAPGSAPTAIGP